MRRYNVKCLAAVGRDIFQNRHTLRPYDRKRGVYQRHNHTTENAGHNGISRNRRRLFYAESLYRIYNNYSERKACKRIHCLVTFKKALEKRTAYVFPTGLYERNVSYRLYKRRDRKQRKADEEQRGEYFSNPGQYLSRSEREPKHRRKKNKRECPDKPFCRFIAYKRLYTDGKRCRSAARYRKERPDRKIQSTSEYLPVSFSDLAAHFEQSVAAAHTERGNAEKRNSDAGYQKADYRLPYVCACILSHKYGKNQVSRTEKQPEKHTANGKCLG